MTTTIESRTYLPEEEVAGRFADIVNAASSQEATPRLVVGDKAVELTPGMADVLVRVAQAMQQGLAVTVAPQTTRLTTQEAADMLGIGGSISAMCSSTGNASGGLRMKRCRTWWRTPRRWAPTTTIPPRCARRSPPCARKNDSQCSPLCLMHVCWYPAPCAMYCSRSGPRRHSDRCGVRRSKRRWSRQSFVCTQSAIATRRNRKATSLDFDAK